ncbi:MAG: GIY-YIG nuclease family protein [Flavipsychrobacter sp.]|nr:GIY-YIG nuclease family protein [Flavipsychrobacter sp.]
MPFHVYILFSNAANKYYVGSCEDMTTRLAQHNNGRNKSTKAGCPWELRKIESYNTRSEAMQREAFIKKMKSRKFIELVINNER